MIDTNIPIQTVMQNDQVMLLGQSTSCQWNVDLSMSEHAVSHIKVLHHLEIIMQNMRFIKSQ